MRIQILPIGTALTPSSRTCEPVCEGRGILTVRPSVEEHVNHKVRCAASIEPGLVPPSQNGLHQGLDKAAVAISRVRSAARFSKDNEQETG